MMEYQGQWDKTEVADFLEESTIPIRLSFISSDDKPWMLSLWYQFQDGELICATEKNANVVQHLTERPYCAFEISTNEAPYKGVRGKGDVTIEPDEEFQQLRQLVDRYIGTEETSFREWLLGRDVEEVKIRIQPEKIYSWDYSDRMKELSE